VKFFRYRIPVLVWSVLCGTHTTSLYGAKNKIKNVLVKARVMKNRIQMKVKFHYRKRSEKNDVDFNILDDSTNFKGRLKNHEETSSCTLDVDSQSSFFFCSKF
jgi:hypothetical protein